MPELPDVEVYRRRVDETSLGKTIEEVEVRDDYLVKDVPPETLAERMEGDRFVDTRRHGKYLFVETGRGPRVLFHFGMSGFLRWLEDPDGETEYPKLLWHFEGDGVLVFDCRRKLGEVRLVDDPDRWIAGKDLGPDALDDGFDRDAFREALSGRRGFLKTALMNQSIMAGVGNEFSDEILFQLGLHPKTPVKALSGEELEAAHETMTGALEAAIAAEMDPDELPGGFLVPGREEGARCPRCGGDIARIEVSGRGSYYCPACQGEEP